METILFTLILSIIVAVVSSVIIFKLNDKEHSKTFAHVNEEFLAVINKTKTLESELQKERNDVCIANENRIIGYCRVFGRDIRKELPGHHDDKGNPCLLICRNAILFRKPMENRHHTQFIGICYNPEEDFPIPANIEPVLEGHHLGLQCIRSIDDPMCGDYVENLLSKDEFEKVLEELKEQFQDVKPFYQTIIKEDGSRELQWIIDQGSTYEELCGYPALQRIQQRTHAGAFRKG